MYKIPLILLMESLSIINYVSADVFSKRSERVTITSSDDEALYSMSEGRSLVVFDDFTALPGRWTGTLETWNGTKYEPAGRAYLAICGSGNGSVLLMRKIVSGIDGSRLQDSLTVIQRTKLGRLSYLEYPSRSKYILHPGSRKDASGVNGRSTGEQFTSFVVLGDGLVHHLVVNVRGKYKNAIMNLKRSGDVQDFSSPKFAGMCD